MPYKTNLNQWRIPPELLDEEKTLKSALALDARKLAEKPSPDEERSLREHSFNLMRRYDAFIRNLETGYPHYFNLKFNTKIPSITQLQSMLNETTWILSYFIDDKNNHVYIFLIRKQHYKIWQREMGESFAISGRRLRLFTAEVENTTYGGFEILAAFLLGSLRAHRFLNTPKRIH